MKPAILVTSHPNTLEKERILKDFGNFISQYNIPHYLATNYPSSKESQLEFTQTYFINHNPPGISSGVVWKDFPQVNLKYKKIIPNWCYSGTYLILEGVKLLKHLGYTHVIFLMYDLEPSFPKIQEFINFSLEKLKDKKGVFVTDPAPDWGEVLTTTQFACDINFFIDIFETELTSYYYSGGLCEVFWYQVLSKYLNDIIILPKEHWIKSTYDSGAVPQTPQGEKYHVGSYYENIILIIETNNLNLIITNSQSEVISYNVIYNSPNQICIEFPQVNLESYYINEHYLFTNTDEWRSYNYFEKINN